MRPFLRRLVGAAGGVIVASALILVPSPASAAGARPLFQLPFACGDVWRLSTYPGHDDYDIDMVATSGTTLRRPILASFAGTVARAGWDNGGGWFVRLDHGNGWQTLYLHMVQAPSVSAGQAVSQGHVLGLVGSTGNSSGPHLHFEQLRDGAKTESWFNGVPSGITNDDTSPSVNFISNNCGVPYHDQSVIRTGDYTGDGKADIIGQYVNGDMRAWPSSGVIATGQALFAGPGNGVLVGSGFGPANAQRTLTADFTGDGKTDLIAQFSNGDLRAWPSSGAIAPGQALFTGPGSGVLVGSGWGPGNVQRILTADFTGDGKTDIIGQYTNGELRAWPSSGVIATGQALFTGPGNGVLVGSGWAPGNVQRILTADFTGDGKADIIAQYANGDMRAWQSSGVIATGQVLFAGPGNGVLVGSGWGPGNVQRILTADFTGDGKTDIIGQYANGDMRAWQSSGVIATGQVLFAGPGNGVLVGSGWGPENVQRVLIADYTGDGKTDIIAQYANGDMRAWQSSGVIATGQVLFAGPGNGVLVGNGWGPGNVQRIL